MLFYHKITESEGINNSEGVDVIHDNGVFSSKQCEICHFYLFGNRNFNYQPYVCNECHGASFIQQSYSFVLNEKIGYLWEIVWEQLVDIKKLIINYNDISLFVRSSCRFELQTLNLGEVPFSFDHEDFLWQARQITGQSLVCKS